MRRAWVIVTIVLTTMAGVAGAQTARERERHGFAQFKRGAYAEAIADWQAAFDETGKPSLLFNIGLASAKKGDRAAAVAAFDHYLQLEPSGEASPEARTRLEGLRREMAEEKGTGAARLAADAQKSLEAGAFDDAIGGFERAERMAPDPEHLYGIAEAQRGKQDRPAAIATYQRYLAAGAGVAHAAEARASLDALRAEIAGGEQKTQAEEQARQEQERQERARREVASRPAPAPVVETRDEERRGGGGRRGLVIAGIVTTSAGVAIAGAGLLVFGSKARSLDDEVSSTQVWEPGYDDKVSDGEAANRNMLIATGVGAAAIVAGGVMVLIGSRSSEPPRRPAARALRVAPRILSSGAAITIGSDF